MLATPKVARIDKTPRDAREITYAHRVGCIVIKYFATPSPRAPSGNRTVSKSVHTSPDTARRMRRLPLFFLTLRDMPGRRKVEQRLEGDRVGNEFSFFVFHVSRREESIESGFERFEEQSCRVHFKPIIEDSL